MLVADKNVVKQVTDKLEKIKKTENMGNSEKNSAISHADSKLQASKINKSNHEGCILKDYYINGKHQRHWYKVDTNEDLGDAVDTFYFTENQKKEIKDLRIKYYDSMKTLFNTVFYNENKNLKAHFTKKSVDKICSDKAIKKSLINGFTSKDHFEAALNIKSLFEKAEFVGSFKDINNDPNVIAMHRFQQIINLSSGKKAVAYMTVKESKEHGNKFYTLELMLKKYPSQLSKGFLQRLNNSEPLTISCKPLDNFIIPNSNNLSIKKSLTYSGHKLQDRTTFAGMNISIENKKGSYRSGVDGDGHKWRTYMNYDYGYIRGTEGTDGDHVDVYLGPDKDSNKVYIIHQNDPVTHKYDEDKCMLCFNTADEAKKAYMKQYDRPGFYGSMDTMTIDEFKSYVFSKSNKGKRIHKSLDITIQDITENNKYLKIKQTEKALNAYLNDEPFIIKHIGSDDSQKYENITLRIRDFDRDSVNKAVRKMSFSLDEPIEAGPGEAFIYKSQEQLTNLLVREITSKTKQVYQFIIDYFDLPEMRIVQKSKLRYKGQILYNPETGEAIKKSDWNKFVKALKEFVKKMYDGTGEKIVINARLLGKILQKMSKTHSFDQIKKLPLEDLEKPHRNFDWISNTAMDMKDNEGNELTRQQQARIQAAIDSAAQRVTKITDTMRNDMQQIIIDGVKDRQNKSKISQNLFDKCVGLNRDFQRIADTEIQNNTTSAYINEEVYHTKEGEKVYFKRFEVIDGNTCKYCKEMKGTVALFSDIPLESENIKDDYAEIAIWEGKKDGVPFGVFHPWCRGSWYRYFPENEI